MYLRFKTKKKKPTHWVKNPNTLLYVSVVESVRINGQPRQKTIKYLGSIELERLEKPEPFSRIRFWEKADQKLAELVQKGHTKTTVKALEKQIKAKIKKPTKRELAAQEREMQALINNMEKMVEL